MSLHAFMVSPLADAFIAAIALANGFTVATRDTRPLEAAGVTAINPWEGWAEEGAKQDD
jgi:predicted nucleic acid-binding protein